MENTFENERFMWLALQNCVKTWVNLIKRDGMGQAIVLYVKRIMNMLIIF